MGKNSFLMETEQFDAFVRMNVLFIQNAWWE